MLQFFIVSILEACDLINVGSPFWDGLVGVDRLDGAEKINESSGHNKSNYAQRKKDGGINKNYHWLSLGLKMLDVDGVLLQLLQNALNYYFLTYLWNLWAFPASFGRQLGW